MQKNIYSPSTATIRLLLIKHWEFTFFQKRAWPNTPLGKICQNEFLFVPVFIKDTGRQRCCTTHVAKRESFLKGLLQLFVTRNEFAWRYFSHKGLFCPVVLLAATSCSDIQHHRQVSVLQNLHQPLRLFPRPAEVEVQPVLSGQWWYERGGGDKREVIIWKNYCQWKHWRGSTSFQNKYVLATPCTVLPLSCKWKKMTKFF